MKPNNGYDLYETLRQLLVSGSIEGAGAIWCMAASHVDVSDPLTDPEAIALIDTFESALWLDRDRTAALAALFDAVAALCQAS